MKISQLIGAIIITMSAHSYAGFIDNNSSPTSATNQSISQVRDGAHVRLEGHLVNSLGGEHYLFKTTDNQEVVVEIEREDFRGLDVDAHQKVRLQGEIEREGYNTYVEVEYLELI